MVPLISNLKNLLFLQAGVLMVWKADAKGRLQQNPLHQHHIQEPLKIMLYRPVPPPDPNKYVKFCVNNDIYKS